MCILSDELKQEIGLDIPLPKLYSLWKHNESGEVYQVYDFTNLQSTRSKYPIRISYRRMSDQSTWSRPLTAWYQDYNAV